jgi:5S rRNA maturation endonuclease (ribonuclease M5)
LKQKASRSQIYSICSELSDKIPSLLIALKINYAQLENRIVFPCPVHNGDNPEGSCIFTDGTKSKGNWVCWTHGCEKDHGKNLIGFVKGVLQNKKNKAVSFSEALKFCLDFLNRKLEDIEDEEISETLYNINKIIDIMTYEREQISTGIKRETILSAIDIPSPYFIGRGFLPETLLAFDVGDCHNKEKQMFNRAVVPVYDFDYNYIGCVGRSLDPENKKWKWVNSKGFKTSKFLYGLWKAKEFIEKTSTVILVEGQGDVWRLYEAGIKNAIGIFGSSLGDDQLSLLEELSILNVVILTDSDEAGQKALNGIINKCGRRFNYYTPKISTKDIGEMSVQQIEKELKPQIEGLY